MDNILDRCELKINIYYSEDVSDEVIKNIIDGCEKDDVMLTIFFRYQYQLNPEKASESFDYFINLVNKIARISGFDYSEDELNIYRMFVVPLNYKNVLNEENLSNFISNCEKVDSLTVSGDVLLYAQERVRYKLLQIYSDNLVKYYDKMKDLLSRLKKNKKRYDELENIIYERLNQKE